MIMVLLYLLQWVVLIVQAFIGFDDLQAIYEDIEEEDLKNMEINPQTINDIMSEIKGGYREDISLQINPNTLKINTKVKTTLPSISNLIYLKPQDLIEKMEDRKISFGYRNFDIVTPDGRFSHSGFQITPQGTTLILLCNALVSMRFRRH